MKLQGNSGFTLVELMAGMVSAAVLALVFSAVMIYGYKGWTRLKAESAMQCDADVAMRTMDRIGRVASNATVSANTLNLILTNGVTQTFSKQGSGSNLLWTVAGVTSVLISNRVSMFTNVVSPDGATVAIKLILAEGSETMDMQYSIFLRN